MSEYYKVNYGKTSCQIPVLAELYENAFGKKDDGLFVEVGAFDGEFVSNTCFLADMGWQGLYIEPHPRYAELCELRHKDNNVKVVKFGAGEKEGPLILHDGWAMTTSKTSYLEAYKEIDWAQPHFTGTSISSHQEPLDKILADNNILPDAPGWPNKHIDLLIVDVEGAETEVFNGFSNLEMYRPTMMIVELEDAHPDFQAHENIIKENAKLREYIISLDYSEIYKDEINTVFIA